MMILEQNTCETIEAMEARTTPALLNSFIYKNKSFILACACKAVGHYVTDSDDEYSIALIAFHEAVGSYEEEKGNFHAFAALVIKRRLYDYMRSQSRYAGEIAIEPSLLGGEIQEDAPAIQFEIRQREMELSEQKQEGRPESSPIRDEIDAVQELLRKYGFRFFDLADCSPKAEKTKKACADAVCYMLRHPSLIAGMQASGTLPGKELKTQAKVSPKILERHRRYIIAAIEILNGDYPLLAEYMSYIRKSLAT